MLSVGVVCGLLLAQHKFSSCSGSPDVKKELPAVYKTRSNSSKHSAIKEDRLHLCLCSSKQFLISEHFCFGKAATRAARAPRAGKQGEGRHHSLAAPPLCRVSEKTSAVVSRHTLGSLEEVRLQAGSN